MTDVGLMADSVSSQHL